MNYPARMLCIDGKPREGDLPGAPLPNEMQEYTALREVAGVDMDDQKETPCYEIEELSIEYTLPNGETVFLLFECDRFVPLSGKDEMEYSDSILRKMKTPIKV